MQEKHNVLPGFGLTMGYTLLYLSLIVLIPLSALVLKTFSMQWSQFRDLVTSDRVTSSLSLSFRAAFAAALINAFFGYITAWVLVRYEFPGRRLLDSLIDLPFALPTAVAGISLCALYADNGLIGSLFKPLGIKIAFTELGITIALIFIGLPYIVRTLQPVLEDLDPEIEEAAASLGAGRFQTFAKILFPATIPSLLTGFVLSFSRAVGEYGSIVFISGNLPYKTEIAPLIIITKLEQFDVPGATAVACVMLGLSFIMLLGINLLQRWQQKKG